MGFGNIGIHLAKRLRPFDVKILATKRSWSRHARDSSKSEGKKILWILFISKMLILTMHAIFLAPSVENGSYDDLVDERGNHDDILKFVSKADIVVCCLAMNKETVRPLFSYCLATQSCAFWWSIFFVKLILKDMLVTCRLASWTMILYLSWKRFVFFLTLLSGHLFPETGGGWGFGAVLLFYSLTVGISEETVRLPQFGRKKYWHPFFFFISHLIVF